MSTARPKPRLNILIIGAGMYVCGRGTGDLGTIWPAVCRFAARGGSADIKVASRSPESVADFEEKAAQLAEATGFRVEYEVYPKGTSPEPEAYLDALSDLKDPGVVIVATPDPLHYEMAKTAIEAGKHVLVVKPLTPAVAAARDLTEAAAAAGVHAAVEFHKRLDLANLQIKKALRTGRIGEPVYFCVEYSQRRNIPLETFRRWVESTNVFQYLAVHYVDIIYFFTGAKPIRLTSIGQKFFLSSQGINTYDSVQAIIEWSHGFSSTFCVNWIDPIRSNAMSRQSIKVIGTKGHFESDQTKRGCTLTTDDHGVEEINPYFCQSYPDEQNHLVYTGYGVDSVIQFLEDCTNIASGCVTPLELAGARPTFADAMVSTAVVEAVNKSLASGGKWVSFDEELQPILETELG